MIESEFCSSKTISYGQTLLDKRLRAGHIDEKEKEIILAFLTERIATAERFGDAKYVSYISNLTKFRACYLPKPYYDITKNDLLQAVSDLKNRPIRDRVGDKIVERPQKYKPNSISKTLTELKLFFVFLSENGYADISTKDISRIKSPGYKPKKLDAKDVYSEPMIAELVEQAPPMLKALIWTHYETGARSNEICDMRWQDIEWRSKSAKVIIRDSKQSQLREAYISMNSISHLLAWRNMYPGDADGMSYVFLNQKGDYISYHTLRTMYRKLQESREGLPPFTPHDLRRFRTTNLKRQGVSRSALTTMLWGSENTRCDAGYSQFSADDAISEMEVLHGIKEQTDTQKPLQPNYCPRCGTLNAAGIRFCGQCGSSLSADAINSMNSLESDLRQSPEYLSALQEYIRKEVQKEMQKR